jgi:hypothetical protein
MDHINQSKTDRRRLMVMTSPNGRKLMGKHTIKGPEPFEMTPGMHETATAMIEQAEADVEEMRVSMPRRWHSDGLKATDQL